MSIRTSPWISVIVSLGGAAELARRLGTPDAPLTRQHIQYWVQQGIPTKYHDAVQALLEEDGLPRAPRSAFPGMVAPPARETAL